VPGSIYLIQDDKLVEMNEEKYESEDLFQRLLAQYANLLAGDQIDAPTPRRWLLVSREVGVPSEENGVDRWSLDHLFLDQDGIPTLVELKRSTNTEIRRMVVGQMLDYAANAVANWSVETIRALFESTCASEKRDPAQQLSISLGFEGEPSTFWENVKTNLQAGKIRMIFVADEIPQELRRIVEFLNKQMDPAQVLALELHQYTGKGLKIMVPRVIGQTAKPEQPQSSEPWNEERFMKAVETAEERKVAEDILDWAQKKQMEIRWGRGKQYGTFSPALQHKGVEFHPFVVWTSDSLQFNFGLIQYQPPFDSEEKRLELLAKLNDFVEKKLPKDAINKYPSTSLSGLKKSSALEKFKSTFDWFIQEVKAS